MGEIVAVTYTTLDGAYEDPGWSGPYFNDEISQFQAGNLAEVDVMLLGRKTYEGFKEAWPKMEDQTGDFGRKMNSMPKWVATTTLTEPEWNARFIPGDVAEFVTSLRAEPGTVLINGSATLVNYLVKHNLLDEWRVMVYPLVLGAGRKFWQDGTAAKFDVAKAWTSKSGVSVVTYAPAAA
jgi:dihydrofolate reductase